MLPYETQGLHKSGSGGQHQSTFRFRVFVGSGSQVCTNASSRSCTLHATWATQAEQRMVIQQTLKPCIGEQDRSAELHVPRLVPQQDTTLSGESCCNITILRSCSFQYYFLTDADHEVSMAYAINDRSTNPLVLLKTSAPAC